MPEAKRPARPRAMRDRRRRLVRRVERLGLELPADLLDSLEAYLDLLTLWNAKMNLTGADLDAAPDEALDRLIAEPLAAVQHVRAEQRVLWDIGSGGGSPAIPMKLATPRLALRLFERKNRKAAFLREAARRLTLEPVDVETTRVEELLAQPDMHDAADLVTIRGVRVDPQTLSVLQAFVRPGGEVWLFRGERLDGTDVLAAPPLRITAVHPLVDTLKSRLVVLSKST